MNYQSRRGNLFLGLVLIVLGLLFFLGNLDLADIGNVIVRWWPMILIAIAAYHLASEAGRRTWGPYILLALGLLFQAIQLDVFDWDVFEYVWPLVLVALGVRVMFGSRVSWKGRASRTSTTGDVISVTAFLGSSEQSVISQQFDGGRITALFGGVDLDLRQARLAAGDVILDVTAMFGGVEIMVPTGWRVVVKGTPILGGIENKVQAVAPAVPAGMPPPPEVAVATLWIDAFVFCGGVEVHN
jgi:predicted membrane protein